ncbi:unnamed protein product [Timema podura]|uniref:Uncharacterized protein n=1 Tax=Timema podura TaxID=61482 RepID=A0ABN7PF18_TIMPD|nr:unnamed protein product [Timema podura]
MGVRGQSERESSNNNKTFPTQHNTTAKAEPVYLKYFITDNRSHYSSRRKIKQLPVKLRIDGVSRVTCRHPCLKGLCRVRCVGTLRDYLEGSTLDHVIANATIEWASRVDGA